MVVAEIGHQTGIHLAILFEGGHPGIGRRLAPLIVEQHPNAAGAVPGNVAALTERHGDLAAVLGYVVLPDELPNSDELILRRGSRAKPRCPSQTEKSQSITSLHESDSSPESIKHRVRNSDMRRSSRGFIPGHAQIPSRCDTPAPAEFSRMKFRPRPQFIACDEAVASTK